MSTKMQKLVREKYLYGKRSRESGQQIGHRAILGPVATEDILNAGISHGYFIPDGDWEVIENENGFSVQRRLVGKGDFNYLRGTQCFITALKDYGDAFNITRQLNSGIFGYSLA